MKCTIVAMIAWLALLGIETAAAQSWPTRPVRVVIPFPPGGNIDPLARVLFKYMAPELGQPIIIDNRSGANGILGSDIVAKATPDGHTFLYTPFAFAINPAIMKNMPFDVLKDFVPVTNVGLGTGYLLVINPSLPAKSVKELIALAKQKPLRYSTPGVGNGQHLAGALFAQRAGVEMLHVPYRGGSAAITAVMGGEVDIHFPSATAGLPQVQAGKVRALGFTGAKRLSALPEVPTIAEAGLPGYVSDAGWHAMFAPAKTPPAIVSRMHAAVHKALEVPAVRDSLLQSGYEPQGLPPAEWAKAFREDVKRYAEICRIAKIEPE